VRWLCQNQFAPFRFQVTKAACDEQLEVRQQMHDGEMAAEPLLNPAFHF
jgi:hypothetical protein